MSKTNSALPFNTYQFIWRRQVPGSQWRTKSVRGTSLEGAVAIFTRHLDKIEGFPDQIVVDHFVWMTRENDESVEARLTLTKTDTPYQIEHANQVHPVGFFGRSK